MHVIALCIALLKRYIVSNNTLIVGTYSTWSIRAWVCLKLAKFDFTEQVITLEKPDFKAILNKHSSTGLVPVLTTGHSKIHDSLAIAEYANEVSAGALYPKNITERALARSYCAELHSGFMSLRSHCPFKFTQQLPIVVTSELQQELERLTELWSLAQNCFMFEAPSIVDAFYAVLAYRLRIYGIELPAKAGQYQQSLIDWPLFKEAIANAKRWGVES